MASWKDSLLAADVFGETGGAGSSLAVGSGGGGSADVTDRRVARAAT
jgi:hypothetical protein